LKDFFGNRKRRIFHRKKKKAVKFQLERDGLKRKFIKKKDRKKSEEDFIKKSVKTNHRQDPTVN